MENIELRNGFFYSGQAPTIKGSFVGRLQSKYGLEEGVYLADSMQPSGIGMTGYGRGYTSDRYYEGGYKQGKCSGFGR